MAKLIYSALTSLDGYVADEDGDFSWGAPDEEVHTFLNDLIRPVGTHLYGRRTVVVGGGNPALPDAVPLELQLRDERRFGNGMVYLGYEVGGRGAAIDG